MTTIYTSISLPKELFEEIKNIVENRKDLGYSNPTEFIKEAVRSYLFYVKSDVDMQRKVDSFDKFQKPRK